MMPARLSMALLAAFALPLLGGSELAQPASPPPDPLPCVHVPESELPSIRAAAEVGEAAALVKLGHYLMEHYEEGYANEQKAGECFRKAAEAGHAEGQAWYAVWLMHVALAPRDTESEAYAWAERAGDQGNALGRYIVGQLSIADLEEERVFWWRPAAEQGFVPAQRELGFLLKLSCRRNGLDRAMMDEARAWIARAASCGDCSSLMVAAGYGSINKGEPLEEYISLKESAISSALAREWRWYDAAFDFDCSIRRGVAGGARWYQLIRTHQHLARLYRLAGRPDEARAVPGKLITLLKAQVEQEPVAANYALAELFKNWSRLYFREDPCPEDYRPYAQKAAGAAGNHYYDPLLRHRASEM